MIASKSKIPVKIFNSVFLHNSVLLLYITSLWCALHITLSKGIPRLRDFVEYFISTFNYLVILLTVSTWSYTTSLLRTREVKQNSSLLEVSHSVQN